MKSITELIFRLKEENKISTPTTEALIQMWTLCCDLTKNCNTVGTYLDRALSKVEDAGMKKILENTSKEYLIQCIKSGIYTIRVTLKNLELSGEDIKIAERLIKEHYIFVYGEMRDIKLSDL